MKLSRKGFLAGLTTVVVLTRLPLLFNGYGADGDAWRVAYVGHRLWSSGVYEISRPPGYPAHEFLSAPLVALGGSVLSNAVTLIASILAVFAWQAFVRDRTQQPGMLTLAFAFAPLFWMNSAATMDYNWSLLMILLAMHAIIRMRPVGAGFLAGLAIGFRPTNAVLLLPLILFLWRESSAINASSLAEGFRRRGDSSRDRFRQSPAPQDSPQGTIRTRAPLPFPLIGFIVSCSLTVVALFLPVFFTYGVSGWLSELRAQYASTSISRNDTLLSFVYRTVYAIGPLASLGMLWILLKKGALSAAWKTRNHLFTTSVAAVCTLLAVFALFPLEKSYLLAGLPFLLLILDRLATPRALSLFALFLISFAVVNPDVVRHGGARGTPGFNIHAGMVIEDWQQRKELGEWRNRLASVDVPERTVIMTGVGPLFWFENNAVEAMQNPIVRNVNDVVVSRRGNPLILFVPMIPREETFRLEHLGWRVVCDAKNRDYIQRTMGYQVAAIPDQQRAP